MALAAHDALMINYSALSSIAFLVWDLLLTFDDEVTYIWPQPKRSPSKWLFLFTRYYSLVCQMALFLRSLGLFGTSYSYRACLSWVAFQSTSLGALTVSVELILTIRVYALYAGSRHIRIFIVALFTFEQVAMMPCLIITLSRTRFTTGCIAAVTKSGIVFLAIFATTSLMNQIVLFVLALYKSIEAIRKSHGRCRVATIVARDSLWVFILITFVLVIEGFLFQFLGPVMQTWLFTWMLSIFTFSSCRLILNICRLGAKGSSVGMEPDEVVLTSNMEGILLDVLHPPQVRTCHSGGMTRLRVGGARVDDTNMIIRV